MSSCSMCKTIIPRFSQRGPYNGCKSLRMVELRSRLRLPLSVQAF